jgi:pimeloyl-ACP methyl ester carboxylesterase
LLLAAVAAAAALPVRAQAQAPLQASEVGVLLLHGLNGSSMSMSTLSYELREKGHLVANPDMPWSAIRSHDVPVEAAERMALAEIADLRRKGARFVVVAGFSKGGLFAAYLAGRHPVDALVAMAPNGASNAKDLADELAQARALIEQGKGQERTMLNDYDVARRVKYPVPAVPLAFVSWYDPEGAMNWQRIMGALKPMPVLLVVPTRDLPNLLAMKSRVFADLPPHPMNRLYEPDSNHIGTVNASATEVVRWIGQVVAQPPGK